jgi:glutamate 5-kinase
MQACAAVGQSLLMHTYEQLFFGKKVVAQLLLSSDDFTSPIRYRNLQNALHELLKLGVVPVVNENDSVSVRELVGAFGDNDELSALLATAVKADWLLLLTDVDGFYFPNGKRPRLLRTISKLTASMEAVCNGQGKLGTGGMRSKLRAGKAGQRSRRQRRHCQRAPCPRHSVGPRTQDRNLFSSAEKKVFQWQLACALPARPATSCCARRELQPGWHS